MRRTPQHRGVQLRVVKPPGVGHGTVRTQATAGAGNAGVAVIQVREANGVANLVDKETYAGHFRARCVPQAGPNLPSCKQYACQCHGPLSVVAQTPPRRLWTRKTIDDQCLQAIEPITECKHTTYWLIAFPSLDRQGPEKKSDWWDQMRSVYARPTASGTANSAPYPLCTNCECQRHR